MEIIGTLADFVTNNSPVVVIIVLNMMAVVYLVKENNGLKNDIKAFTEDVRRDKKDLWDMIYHKEPIKEVSNEAPGQIDRKTGTEHTKARGKRTPRNERSLPKKRPE